MYIFISIHFFFTNLKFVPMLILKFFSTPLASVPKIDVHFKMPNQQKPAKDFSETRYFNILHFVFVFFFNKNDDFRFQQLPKVLKNKNSKTLR